MLRPEEKELSHLLAASDTEDSSRPKNAIKWIVISLFTLIGHVGFLSVKTSMFPKPKSVPVEVQQIDPSKLQAIKDQWKQKSLLLSKDKSPVDPNIKAPPNARYEADRNRIVEKEQRARQTNVIPNQGGSKSKNQSEPKRDPQPLPKISDLGNLSNLPSRPQPEPRIPQNAGNPGDTGDQALLDRDLPIGAENLLNTQESIYYSFYARIYEAIGPLWQSKIRGLAGSVKVPIGDYTTQVQVILDRDGNFLETRILRSSGVTLFDRSVDDSWRKVPRFPNPPRALLDSQGLLHMVWTFSVQVDKNSGFQYVPPERQM
jgi:hypothetical protein